jgi:hypothetical protein
MALQRERFERGLNNQCATGLFVRERVKVVDVVPLTNRVVAAISALVLVDLLKSIPFLARPRSEYCLCRACIIFSRNAFMQIGQSQRSLKAHPTKEI